MNEILTTDRFNADEVTAALMDVGAIAVPLISEDARSQMVELLLSGSPSFVITESGIGFAPYRIEKDTKGVFADCARALQDLANQSFGHMVRDKERRPFEFNHFTLLHYHAGSELGPHVDGAHWYTLTCSAVLLGDSSFYVCKNEDGEAVRHQIGGLPGDVIFMRERGFDGNFEKVVHGVEKVEERGLSTVLRQQRYT